MIRKLFGAMIGTVIGLALTPIVIDVTSDVTTTYGAAGTDVLGTGVETLLNLLPLLYVIVIIAGAIAYIKFSN
jgi:hypothetical protein